MLKGLKKRAAGAVSAVSESVKKGVQGASSSFGGGPSKSDLQHELEQYKAKAEEKLTAAQAVSREALQQARAAEHQVKVHEDKAKELEKKLHKAQKQLFDGQGGNAKLAEELEAAQAAAAAAEAKAAAAERERDDAHVRLADLETNANGAAAAAAAAGGAAAAQLELHVAEIAQLRGALEAAEQGAAKTEGLALEAQ
eukprot:g1842.t1